jgi:peptidoglycan/xylan/chitin deacetylase (PgdA/CDA1 family)
MFADTIEVGRQRSSFAASAARLARRASHRAARHLPLPPRLMRNREPLITFTFDDVPVSAHAAGAAILEEYGARATFYVATGLLGERSDFWRVIGADEVADLHRRGHEIALHSHLHRPTPLLDAEQLAADLQRNREVLRHIHPGIAARNFAYPFGQCTLACKYQLTSMVRSSRSIYAGVNRVLLDPHYIRSTELCDARLTRENLDIYLDQAQRRCGWLVFCLHDVADMPSPHGCSRRFLDHALEHVARRGMRIATVDGALDIITGERACTPTDPIAFSQELSHG